MCRAERTKQHVKVYLIDDISWHQANDSKAYNFDSTQIFDRNPHSL